MEKLKRLELEDYLQKTEELVRSINDNKHKIIDIYIKLQSELYEVDEENEEEFLKILQSELRNFLKTLKVTTLMFQNSPFQYEKKFDAIELNDVSDFKKVLSFINLYTEEIGGEFLPELEESIYEMVYNNESDNDKIEELREQKEILSKLIDYLIEFTSELEVLLEIEDEVFV